jgi:hypothetical protein
MIEKAAVGSFDLIKRQFSDPIKITLVSYYLLSKVYINEKDKI